MTVLADVRHERRDFLTLLAGSMLGVGALAAAWPLVDSLNPAAGELEDNFTHLDLSNLQPGQTFRTFTLGKFTLVTRRTAAELAFLKHWDRTSHARPLIAELPYCLNWHRSFDPEILVVYPVCTIHACLLLWGARYKEMEDTGEAFVCPCCGSQFDSAGRVMNGPAFDLIIPPHWLPNRNHLVIGQNPPESGGRRL